MTVANVTIQGSAETAIQFYASKNSTADTVRVVPRPGTGLLGSNGDAIHFASTRQNNHIVNSYAARGRWTTGWSWTTSTRRSSSPRRRRAS